MTLLPSSTIPWACVGVAHIQLLTVVPAWTSCIHLYHFNDRVIKLRVQFQSADIRNCVVSEGSLIGRIEMAYVCNEVCQSLYAICMKIYLVFVASALVVQRWA